VEDNSLKLSVLWVSIDESSPELPSTWQSHGIAIRQKYIPYMQLLFDLVKRLGTKRLGLIHFAKGALVPRASNRHL
jgi:hypothetical protein